MKMNKQGKIEWLEVLIWIVLIILFGMILTRIFGNSATDVQIYVGFVTGLIGIVFFMANHHREIGVMNSEMKHGFEKVGSSFYKVREDMKKMEDKIDSLLNKRGKK